MTAAVETKNKIRWTSKDKEYFMQAADTIEFQGYPRVARELREWIKQQKEEL